MSMQELPRRSFAASLLAPLLRARSGPALVFSCAPENDLYRMVAQQIPSVALYRTHAEAIHRAPDGAGVLLLAANYPETAAQLTDDGIEAARRKHLRVYAEYVTRQSGAEWKRFTAQKERGVVTTSFFGSQLPPMSILSLHSCRVIPPPSAPNLRSHLVLAKVAGFTTAIYGLPQQNVLPLLIELESQPILMAATQLSQFIKARYGPAAAWGVVWRAILQWLSADIGAGPLHWTPAVHPSWSASAHLPAESERNAALRGAGWYFNARLFIHSSWAARLPAAKAYEDRVGPPPTPELPIGDGSLGLLEGHSSRIELDGSQPARWWIRADCVGETSMVLALANNMDGRRNYATVARNLCDFLITKSKMANGTRLDPVNAAYGLIGWNEADTYFKDEDGYDVYYGDDNARCLLGILATAAVTGETRWNARIWLAILANFRLVGTMGYQKSRYDQAPLAKDGWQHHHNSAIVLHDMNYQAYPWALFLWAFSVTGFQPFLDRCEKGIRLTVEAYPQWRWSNSITSQLARLLLPLAWLIRVKDNSETRSWLRKISQELLAHQHASGAIAERTGPAGTGIQVPPTSNELYGGGEGALIQQNGDPATDLLYTMNFGFIGLHEAWAATNEPYYKQACDRVANFLVRVQAQSTAHPQFDGAWYRAFDFQSWDYWASNSDSGWGAWCTEAGWSQSWITTVLMLRLLKQSLWEILKGFQPPADFDVLRDTMFRQ